MSNCKDEAKSEMEELSTVYDSMYDVALVKSATKIVLGIWEPVRRGESTGLSPAGSRLFDAAAEFLGRVFKENTE